VTTSLDIKERWIATARGRAGFAYDRWLFYVTGGAAWAQIEQILSNAILGVTISDTKTLVGWTAGGGIEGTVLGNLSAKVEYLYADFGSKDYFTSLASGGPAILRKSLNDHIVRVGLNYRFGPVGP
jgi:outer membrane immunogenic protein